MYEIFIPSIVFFGINFNDIWVCYCLIVGEDWAVMKVVLEKMVQLREKLVLKVFLAPFAR